MKQKFRILWVLMLIVLVSGCIAPVVPDSGIVLTPTFTETLIVDPLVSALTGLTPEAFLEEAFKQLALRQPEWVSELGLSALYGVRNDQLDDLSPAYLAETHQMVLKILEITQQYLQDDLPEDLVLQFQVFEWYLADRAAGYTFAWHDYPLTHMFGGIDDHYYYLFSDLHPMKTEADAEDFVLRLWDVGPQLTQLIANIDNQISLGIFLPRSLYQVVMSDLLSIHWFDPQATPFYQIYVNRLADIPGLDDARRSDLLTEAEKAIAESVMPGFDDLISFMKASSSAATQNEGAWKLPDGQAYYQYRLQTMTTTLLTADEIHELGLAEVVRIQTEIRQAAASLGYPDDLSIQEIFQQAAQDGGFAVNAQIISTYEMLIDDMRLLLPDYFDLMPQADLEVRGVPQGGYYQSPALDGSRPGIFFASATGAEPDYRMPSLAYHEAIPGHHLQLSIAQELNLPIFQRALGFTGYVEGWALYAERLAWEMGAYEDDPYGNLGRLQYELLRAARLVVDTGLHAKKWTADDVVNYLVTEVGETRGSAQFAALRYMAMPGQAAAYLVGMLEIFRLRDRAMNALGEAFDLKTFHNIVLGSGSLPLPLLEEVVQAYIDANR